MSIIMDDFTPTSAIEEVKKLQDLVKKLEIQNLHLRNKQNLTSRKRGIPSTNDVRPSTRINDHTFPKKDSAEAASLSFEDSDATMRSKDEYFDQLEILKISDMEMSDDESWLYTSPNSRKMRQQDESPYKWLRKDVDDPENRELQLTKKALLTKLNELEILSTQSPTNISHAENPVLTNLRRPQVPYKTPPPVHSNNHAHVDSRTFTRSRKKQAIEFLESFNAFEIERNSTKSTYITEEYQYHRRGSDLSLDSLSSGHVMEDANDVQEVARMQEESLRLSSPIGTPKRTSLNSLSSRKVSLSSKSSVSDVDASLSDHGNSTFNSLVSEDGVSYTQNVTNVSFQLESSNLSDQSSPSESPFGSNVSLNTAGRIKKFSSYGRSLPNLNRDPTGTAQTGNKLSSGQKPQKRAPTRVVTSARRSDSGLQNARKPRKEITSPTRQRQRHQPSHLSSSYSPNVMSHTLEVESRSRARSGLPKPTRASSATRSRSGIPQPSMLSRRSEESWSEGCF